MKRQVALCVVVLAIVAVLAVPWSASAATPTAAAGLSCGATVTNSVKLTNDLINCPVDGLVVGASGITIDLNGHRITGTSGAGPDDLFRCLCGINDRGGFSRITLRGGHIENFVFGADFYGTHDIVVRDLSTAVFWEDAVFFDHVIGGLVTNSNLLNSYRGVETNTSNNIVVRDSIASGIQHAAVAFFGTTNSVVRDMTIGAKGGDYGIEIVNSSNNLIANNQVHRFAFDGIFIAGATGLDFVATLPSNGNSIVDNDVRNGSGYGIEVAESDGGVVRDTLVARNVIVGINITDGVQPDGTGIQVHAYLSADGQGNPPFRYQAGVGPSGTRIRANTTNGNVVDGIHLDAPHNVIAGNVANRNGRWGIYAYPGNTDGGGNRASGNGQPAQCSGVVCA